MWDIKLIGKLSKTLALIALYYLNHVGYKVDWFNAGKAQLISII